MQEIESLYRVKIEPQLAPIRNKQKKLQKEYVITGITFLAVVGFLIPIFVTENMLFLAPFILVLVFLVWQLIKANKLYKDFRSDFKRAVVREIVIAINPEWVYEPDRMIHPDVYAQSDIFRTRYDRYLGDDYVRGVIEKTNFECSELHTEYKQVTHDSKGRRQEHWVTIFKGLFFNADFNKEFKGRTYVSPDYAEKILGKFGRKFQGISGAAPLVQLESVEFEKVFVVHSTDQIEARYILTPALMEAMLRIKQQINCDVHFSFVGSRVYCAMGMRKNLFEPRVFGQLADTTDVTNMYRLFEINKLIIRELNLNTRIWTKY